ncbi:hypothetical protein [Ligilactobacillus ruminis]|uniref:hypothetical protein n=1 Tax=Ligilactobacillus ruminis TaxID=1623 RepID=UPI0022E0D69C|nr:hypothetical protein [Ligilactobacillus ruminis]
MTVDYRDPTHIMPTDSPVDQSKVSEANKTLAKWLRQKMYGVDVRESLARLAEQTSADVYDDRQTVLDYKNHANNEEQALRNLANKLSQEFNSILNSKTDNAEVINARIDVSGAVYETLKSRLDAMQLNLNTFYQAGQVDPQLHILCVKDIATDSDNVRSSPMVQITGGTSPDGDLTVTSSTRMRIDKVKDV